MERCKYEPPDGCGLFVLFLFVVFSSCTLLDRTDRIEKKLDKLATEPTPDGR